MSILSHTTQFSFDEKILEISEKIRNRGDLPYVTVERQLELLGLLSTFDLGRFLLLHGGLNGYWIDYAIQNESSSNVIEDFILNKSPFALATRERFGIFKTEIQKRVREEVSFASIPCGVMSDLLTLDFSEVTNFTLTGIDLDPDAMGQGNEQTRFLQRDAWNLQIEQKFDLVTSNGLNIYEPDHDRVVALYRQFHIALKADGVLVTSFLAVPKEWNLKEVNPQDAVMQKILFLDIINSKWQVFRTEAEVRAQLEDAGFAIVEVLYDKAHIFPTIVAKKLADNYVETSQKLYGFRKRELCTLHLVVAKVNVVVFRISKVRFCKIAIVKHCSR